MANPRQRRKARSSSYKPVKQSQRQNKVLKKQRPVKGPKILQDAWDNHKTVRQNYAALGLAHSLTPNDSGGHEIPLIQRGNKVEEDAKLEKPSNGLPSEAGHSKHSSTEGRVPRGYGRLIRDASGAVVDVILEEKELRGGIETAVHDRGTEAFEIEGPLEEPESTNSAAASNWLFEATAQEGTRNNVVNALETLSQAEVKTARVSSNAEIKYLTRLVDAYGEDYAAMARDRRKNVNQYSAGDLRRAVRKAGLAPG